MQEISLAHVQYYISYYISYNYANIAVTERYPAYAAKRDEPSYRHYVDGEASMLQWRDLSGKTHRENGPAEVEYIRGGEVYGISYYRHGQLHRDRGYAVITFKAPYQCRHIYRNGEPLKW
tara:strand:+ start:40174 stop:40533 length:360 start_codon:yes stop_codon:yes gene_type:complete